MGFFQTVRPYLTAAAVALMVASLVAAVHLTSLELQWTAFLSGILVAAVLAMVSRASHAEWALARRTAQLKAARDRVLQEATLRQSADATAAAEQERRKIIEEDLPAMVAYVNADETCQYANAAFRAAFGEDPAAVEERPLREVLGEKVYGQFQDAIVAARAGRAVFREERVTMRNGAVYHFSAQFVPRFTADGSIAGFYAILVDLTDPADVKAMMQPAAGNGSPASAGQDGGGQEMFVECFTEEVTGWANAGDRILSALKNDEFRLYCQSIVPLSPPAGLHVHYEVLIRLLEEEENLMPPGTFFPLAEKFGLLPTLDRWVVAQVAKRVRSRAGLAQAGTIFFVNLSGATIDDPDFPEYVQRELRDAGITGRSVCVELDMPDVVSRRRSAARLTRMLREAGCPTALSGFGTDRAPFDLMKWLQVDYLKIDGSIVLNMLRNPVDLARMKAMNKVAHASGLKTVAEFVEDRETIEKLREIGVDFAQGFGVSRPRPIDGENGQRGEAVGSGAPTPAAERYP